MQSLDKPMFEVIVLHAASVVQVRLPHTHKAQRSYPPSLTMLTCGHRESRRACWTPLTS